MSGCSIFAGAHKGKQQLKCSSFRAKEQGKMCWQFLSLSCWVQAERISFVMAVQQWW